MAEYRIQSDGVRFKIQKFIPSHRVAWWLFGYKTVPDEWKDCGELCAGPIFGTLYIETTYYDTCEEAQAQIDKWNSYHSWETVDCGGVK